MAGTLPQAFMAADCQVAPAGGDDHAMELSLDEVRRRYADLLVGEAGLNVQPGQRLGLWGAEHDEALVDCIRDAAARVGAGASPTLGGACCFLALLPGGVSFLGQGKAGMSALVGSDGLAELQQVVAAVPTRAWADAVGEEVETLWRWIATACRLGHRDPTAFWLERLATLERRARTLDALGLRHLQIAHGAYYLDVPLHPDARWSGPRLTDRRTHVAFSPNLPSEEVFTAPDPDGVRGEMPIAAPIWLGERRLEQVVLRFGRGGRCRFEGADAGPLAALLEGCERVGEVALVDRTSSMLAVGRPVGHPLLDEQLGCHLGFGAMWPHTLRGGSDAVVAPRHHDVTIGTGSTSVWGRTGDGTRVALMRDGAWVLAD